MPLPSVYRRLYEYYSARNFQSTRMLAVVARISGALDVRTLAQSIGMVSRRHEALRTRFLVSGGSFNQQVDAPLDLMIEPVDVSVSSTEIDASIERLAGELVDESIDLSVGPLFAVRLYRISRSEHALIMALDHLIADGVSTQIVHMEVWALYYEIEKKLPPSLPPVPLQFADHMAWREQMSGASLAGNLAYWTEHLHGAPRIEIPVEQRPASGKAPTGAAALTFQFGDSGHMTVRELARRERVLPVAVILTFYIILMSRWCNESDIVVMFLSHGRVRPELTRMAGNLVGLLLMRVRIDDADCFVDLLRRVHLEYCSALDHYDFNRSYDLIPTCHTDLLFNCVQTGWDWSVDHLRRSDDQAVVRAYPFRRPVELKFACSFLVTQSACICRAEYRPDLVAADSVNRFAKNLQNLSREMAMQPMARIASVLTL